MKEEEWRDTVFYPVNSKVEIWIRINSGTYYQLFHSREKELFTGNYYDDFQHKGYVVFKKSR